MRTNAARSPRIARSCSTRGWPPIVHPPAYNRLPEDAKANQVALNVERASRDAEVQFMNRLNAQDRASRLSSGQQIRGKPVNSPAPTSAVPGFLAPVLSGR